MLKRIQNGRRISISFFEELEIRHVNLYHTVSKDSLEILVKDLKSNLDNFSENETMFELGRVLVNINDGHSGLFFPYANDLNLHRLPLRLRALDQSIIVTNALPEYENLIGLKLTEVEDKKVDNLLSELYEYIPRDNKYGPQGDAGDYLVLSYVLVCCMFIAIKLILSKRKISALKMNVYLLFPFLINRE